MLTWVSMKAAFPPLISDSPDLLGLDFARFVAALGIVSFHAIGFSTLSWRDNVGGFRLFVDFFFVISGFVISYVYSGKIGSTGGYGSFLWKRFARLAPLHWLTLALFVILGIIVSKLGIVLQSTQMFDWSCLAPNIAMVHAMGVCHSVTFNGPSWSISAEVAMYLAAPVVFYLARTPVAGVAALAASLIAFTLMSTPERHWTEWAFDGGYLRAFPSFLVGALLFQFRPVIQRFP
jgi:peptidoglycan/LPS O-acetylase OafA/YrhL